MWIFFLYQDSDPDDSQKLMGSELDQDPSFGISSGRPTRALGCKPSTDFAKIFAKGITPSAPESGTLTRSCSNLYQFFHVKVLMLPKNVITLNAVVLEVYCNKQNE